MNRPIDRDEVLRTPPQSIPAEQAVLGALMLDNRAIAKISDWLREEDFYRQDHRLIYRGIVTMSERSQPCDALTLGEWFEDQGIADQVGGADYVLELASTTPSAANLVAYAEIVSEHSRLRQLIDLGTNLVNAAFNPGTRAADLVAKAQSNLSALPVERRSGLQSIKPAARAFFAELNARYQSKERFSGRLTPWREVNELTLGLKPADLVVLAGRPGMGKSVAGFGLATFDALRDGRPAVFSLEMSAPQFVEREVAALGEVPHAWLRAPESEAKNEFGEPVADEYWSKTSRAIQQLVGSNLLIDDEPGLTIQQIAARAKRAHMQSPLSMVLIDHLHIVKIKGGDNIVNQLGDVSRGAKAIAKDLKCPVILLAQLNRSNVGRADKRPTMADLRGSGEIEQDADYILLLHREDYYDENAYDAGVVELIVGKARNARARKVHLRNRLDQMRFDDWEGPLPDPPIAPQRKSNSRGFD